MLIGSRPERNPINSGDQFSIFYENADLFINQHGLRGEAPQIPPPEIRQSRISGLISVFLLYGYFIL